MFTIRFSFNHRLYKRYASFCIFILSFFLLIQQTSYLYAKADQKKKVLVLNSYHIGFKWTDDIVRGIESVFVSEKDKIDLYIEYMDTKRLSDEHYSQDLYDLFLHKYRLHKNKDFGFDLIISSDDNAFNFLRAYRDKIFPGTPVVFCGVNYLKHSDLKGHELFTGVNEEVDLRSGIEMALKLHPKTKQIVVINDTTTTGKKMHEELMKIIPDYKDSVDFVLLENVEMEEILEKARSLAPDSLAFYTIFSRDKTGMPVSLSTNCLSR